MKALFIFVLGAALPLAAQVAPEATSATTIPINGNLTYSARYSQTDESYPGGAGGQEAIISGDFGYSTSSERKPFSVTFGGGESWVISGNPYNTGPYENLLLSQGLVWEHWSIQLSDNVNYRTGAPIDGFAGVAGTGEPITGAPPPTGETILTLNASVVNNVANAEYNYKLNGFSTMSAGGGYTMQRYPNDNGIDIDSLMANFGWTQRLNARNTVVGQYAYSHFTYPDTGSSFNLNTPTVEWQRLWNRAITSKVAAGPQILSSSTIGQSSTTTTGPTPSQSSVGVSVDASVTDTTRFGAAALAYTHGVNGGGGYLYGGKMDSVTGSLSHQFGHQIESQLTLEINGGYRRTSSLNSQAAISGTGGTGFEPFAGNITAEFGAVQATRALGRYFSANASFTGTEQSYLTQSAPTTGNALNGLWRVISFGIGYTPQPIHLRH